MAYPDTNQDRRERVDPNRDPNAIDTRSSFNWPMVLGIAVAALLVLTLLGSFSNTTNVTNAPADRPAIQTPSEAPTKAPTPNPGAAHPLMGHNTKKAGSVPAFFVSDAHDARPKNIKAGELARRPARRLAPFQEHGSVFTPSCNNNPPPRQEFRRKSLPLWKRFCKPPAGRQTGCAKPTERRTGFPARRS